MDISRFIIVYLTTDYNLVCLVRNWDWKGGVQPQSYYHVSYKAGIDQIVLTSEYSVIFVVEKIYHEKS